MKYSPNDTQKLSATKTAMLGYLAFAYRSFDLLAEESFCVSFGEYFIQLATRVNSPTLEVWVLEREYGEQPRFETEITFNTWGFFTNIHISLPARMRRHSDAIKGIIETVYKTGYSWIEE